MSTFEDQALEDVVDKIMLFGQWPQPSRYRTQPVRFDLVAFVRSDKSGIDPAELAEFFVDGITYSTETFTDRRDRFAKTVTAKLTEHLKDSEIVKTRAAELEEEAREEA